MFYCQWSNLGSVSAQQASNTFVQQLAKYYSLQLLTIKCVLNWVDFDRQVYFRSNSCFDSAQVARDQQEVGSSSGQQPQNRQR